MSVVSFADYTPPARFDSTPWSEVRIEENDNTVLADTVNWTQIDALDLATETDPAGLDPDPSAPEARSFTTSLASATPDLWYRVIFADGSGNVSLPSEAIQNTETVGAYSTTAELFRVVRVSSPTDEQTVAAQRLLDAATIEINQEIDWADDHDPATPEQLELLENVCLNRAADLWRHTESAPGIVVLEELATPSQPGRYSFARYAQMLAPLKDQWGVA